MVFVKVPAGMEDHLDKSGIKVLKGPRLRLVTHLDVDAAGIVRALEGFRGFTSG
jgi:threonine aldolase